MRPARYLIGLLIGLSALGAASASSLGSFDPVTLTAFAATVDPCTATASAFQLDSLLGPIPPVTRIDGFTLTGIEGDCDGATPTVVVEGTEPVLPASRSYQLDPLASPAPSSVTIALDAPDPLGTFVVLWSRAGFTP